MIDVKELIARVRSYNPHCDANLIAQAYAFGMQKHDGQFRQSGEPYFSHPVAVAAILAEQRLDDATIVTALLHDTIEDTKSTYSEIEHLFGTEIAELVDGVTKLTELQLPTSSDTPAEDVKAVKDTVRSPRQQPLAIHTAQAEGAKSVNGAAKPAKSQPSKKHDELEKHNKLAENFRKLFIAMSKDLRVILIKLADRLHNMQTIRSMTPEKQTQKARETVDIYAPLAGRMGMQSMRDELEDLSFKVLNPDARNSIIRRYLTLRRDTGNVIESITADIRNELEKATVEAEVTGRAKKPYSIWRKMQEKDLGFSRLSDVYGFRVICKTLPDCYRVLGAIHQLWWAVPGRFKDYISQPKSNGYRSIHTTISDHNGKRVEVQIRTREMHEVAESGVAAHWAYRDGVRVKNPFAVDPAKWIKDLTESLDKAGHDEFLENVKLEMYSDQVFCFTPKGEVVKLPKGATPLDFAYAIHTKKIGNLTVSAKVDGLRVPLWTRLRNGQSVEIITAEGQRPQASWIDIVKTGRAKVAIRRSLREDEHGHFIRLGQELARWAFEHIGVKFSESALRIAAKRLNMANGQELLARIGSAEIMPREVVKILYPELSLSPTDEAEASRPLIELSDEQSANRASCCQPLPGERIVGITYHGRGVVIHAIDCMALVEFEDQLSRWVDLHWQPGRHKTMKTVSLELTISNDAGVLGRICSLIGTSMANISDLRFTDRKPDFYRLIVDVDLRDTEHLYMIMMSLKADPDVAQISRHRDVAQKPVALH